MEKINIYLPIVCKLINSALNNNTIDLSPYSHDDNFLKIIKEQTFSPFLYAVDKNKLYRESYFASYFVNEKFDKLAEYLKAILDNNKIDHIFLKGFHLRKLYPLPHLRQMGDIDILVKPEDYDIAKNTMIENGAKLVHENEYHADFSINKLNVEIHKHLLSSNQQGEYDGYFNNPFEHSIKIDNHTFELKKQFNLIYLLTHYAKHLRNGAGIRELCDFYLLFKTNDYDVNNIYEIFKLENQEKYIDTIFSALKYIFNFEKYQFTYNDDIELILSYCLDCGIHGFGEQSERAKIEFTKTKENKFIYLLKTLFISVPELFKKYPWTKSIILIPLGYIVRFFYLLTNRNKNLFEVLSTTNENNISKKIGL